VAAAIGQRYRLSIGRRVPSERVEHGVRTISAMALLENGIEDEKASAGKHAHSATRLIVCGFGRSMEWSSV
jgi:hypothetical protein